MRFIETKKLNDYIISNGDVLHCAPEELAARLSSLESVSLQGFSIDHDRAFLRELSSVLNVIVSIINHPHIANRREEVIIRVEQAQQIDREAFNNTIRDSKLWKEHDLRMVPEEVYYHQHIDELRIYENRFIGFLIDLIDKELAKFSSFYLSKLPTLTSLQGTLSSHEIGKQIVQIDRLRRKTQFIKNTYFFREVSKGKPISRKIQPTNILLKDRLYCYCYRFYKRFIRYEDAKAAKRDLRSYYMILLFRELCAQGFVPTSVAEKKYVFENDDYALTLQTVEDEALALTVRNRKFFDTPSHHVLSFHAETEKTIDETRFKHSDVIDGFETLSLWEICYADAGIESNPHTDTEENLIRAWLSQKISHLQTDPYIYKKYCPICRSRGIDNTNEIFTCPACRSSYMFLEDGEDTTVWFRKIRKKGLS